MGRTTGRPPNLYKQFHAKWMDLFHDLVFHVHKKKIWIPSTTITIEDMHKLRKQLRAQAWNQKLFDETERAMKHIIAMLLTHLGFETVDEFNVHRVIDR